MTPERMAEIRAGVTSTHYRDPRAFADALTEAIALVAPIGSEMEAKRGSRLVGVRGRLIVAAGHGTAPIRDG